MAEGTEKLLAAKACYGHLGGTLGNRLFERMLALGWFEQKDGTSTAYVLTETGREAMIRLGVDIYTRK